MYAGNKNIDFIISKKYVTYLINCQYANNLVESNSI